jgi:hypothetical protein
MSPRRHVPVLCVVVLLLPMAALSCGGSGAGNPVPPGQAPYPSFLINAAAPQVTPTFDGTGQVVHPGIARFDRPWHGFTYWLVVTPYPLSDKTKEDPSILASNDGVNWQVPQGLTNPIALPTTSFLADGDLVYDPSSDQLWVYYVEQNVNAHTRVLRKTSSDGVHWSNEEVVLTVLDYELVSPAVEKIGDKFWMWSVNSGLVGGCADIMNVELRTSSDGRNWSAAQVATITTPGYRIWHIEVINVPSRNEKWMLATASRTSVACVRETVQLFAKSTDGLNWQAFNKVALGPGTGWDNSHIYRSTLLYDSARDLIEVWYSGRNGSTGIWHLGYTEANYTHFLQWLTQ